MADLCQHTETLVTVLTIGFIKEEGMTGARVSCVIDGLVVPEIAP